MAKHVQGIAVANATSYKLYKLVSGVYTEIDTQSTGGAIDFDLSKLTFTEGTHELAVKAFDSTGTYADSNYSNTVSYTYVAPVVYYTITYKYMSGSTEIKTATTEQVAAGTTKNFSISGASRIDGYTINSVSPNGEQVINGNITVIYSYINDADLALTNLYNAAEYPFTRCYYGNSLNRLASNTKIVNPSRAGTTASLGLDVQKFPVEAGKTYSIKLYNAPTEATTVGTDEDEDGVYENATTIPYFGFYGLVFWETIDGTLSVRYFHTTSNGGRQLAYWNTSKPTGYTGDIPISETHDTSPFGITSDTPNAGAIVVTNLTTGTKSSELSKKCVFGAEANKFTQAAQVEINDESITHMSILFGCPTDTLYQMGTVNKVKVGVLSDEDRAAAIQTMQNGLVIVEGTRLPDSYIAYEG